MNILLRDVNLAHVLKIVKGEVEFVLARRGRLQMRLLLYELFLNPDAQGVLAVFPCGLIFFCLNAVLPPRWLQEKKDKCISDPTWNNVLT